MMIDRKMSLNNDRQKKNEELEWGEKQKVKLE